jgi:hypothetical protein
MNLHFNAQLFYRFLRLIQVPNFFFCMLQQLADGGKAKQKHEKQAHGRHYIAPPRVKTMQPHDK